MSTGLGILVVLGGSAAACNLLGGWLAVLRPRVADRHLIRGLAFSGGFLLAAALLLILPESLKAGPGAPALVLAGYCLVYLAEHLFAGHAHHVLHAPHGAHPLVGAHLCEEEETPIRGAAATAASAGLLLHSFFDGAAVAAALPAGPAVAVLTFLAVALHKVPEGFSLASIALAAGRTPREAARLAAALGGASLLGTAVAAVAGRMSPGAEAGLLAVACGMFIHIAATDLLPTTSHVKGYGVLAATGAGAAAAALAALLVHALGHTP